jgi:DNA-binding transcriptional LysR family regulator
MERTRQGVILTEAGTVLAQRGRLMMQEAAALVASVREIGREPSGVLRAVLPVGLPPHLLTPIFAAVRMKYPKLSVHVRFSDDPLGGMLDDVDLALHFGPRRLPGNWIVHEIARVKEWLIASADYLKLHGTPTCLEDLDRHELFSWQAPGEDARDWPLLGGGVFPAKPMLVATDIHMIRQCVIAGLGIALLPDALVPDPGILPQTLVPVLPDLVGRQRPVYVAVPAALAEVPKIRAVLEYVRRFAPV